MPGQFRLLACLAAAVMLFAAIPAAAQDVAAARLVYLDGNYDAALKVIAPAAQAGDPVAQNLMGDAYDEGNGVEQNFDATLDWWQKAAAQGLDKAVYNLGLFYREGRPGHPPDLEKAIAYYDRAIEMDYSHAMNNRGSMYERGQGGPVDFEAAAGLYERAADLGNLEARNNLGRLYLNGNGVELDLSEAFWLFEEAAWDGHAGAINNLGAMYENGYNVAVDLLAAIGLYRLAAERGNPQAAINLGYLLIEYESGFTDPARGYGWCLWAQANARDVGGQDFSEDCTYLAGQISGEAQRAGEALAAETNLHLQ